MKRKRLLWLAAGFGVGAALLVAGASAHVAVDSIFTDDEERRIANAICYAMENGITDSEELIYVVSMSVFGREVSGSQRAALHYLLARVKLDPGKCG